MHQRYTSQRHIPWIFCEIAEFVVQAETHHVGTLFDNDDSFDVMKDANIVNFSRAVFNNDDSFDVICNKTKDANIVNSSRETCPSSNMNLMHKKNMN